MNYRYVKIIPLSKLFKQFYPSDTKNCVDLCRFKSDTSSCGDCNNKNAKWPTGNRVTYHFHPETEAIFNEQINTEFKAFYWYLSMASYFGQVDVALPGCESFFMQMHEEEHEHALQCVKYIKMRGGSVKLCVIEPPIDQNWKTPLDAFKMALKLEMEVSDKLVNVNAVATKHGDLNASDFIVTHFIESQMKSVSEIARFVTVLSGIGDQSLARFLFDKDLLENHVLPEFNVLREKDPLFSTKK